MSKSEMLKRILKHTSEEVGQDLEKFAMEILTNSLFYAYDLWTIKFRWIK